MFIISEIAPQFGDDLNLAEQMILQSKLAGAHAAKVQLYPADLFADNPASYLRARESVSYTHLTLPTTPYV